MCSQNSTRRLLHRLHQHPLPLRLCRIDKGVAILPEAPAEACFRVFVIYHKFFLVRGGWDHSITLGIRQKSRVSSPAPNPPDPCQSRSQRHWYSGVFPVVLWRVSIHKKEAYLPSDCPAGGTPVCGAIRWMFRRKNSSSAMPSQSKKAKKKPSFG